MKIHKTVNPVAYENTYYLEGEQHLIVVDPGSNWEAIRKTIETNQQTGLCHSSDPHSLRPYYESRLGQRYLWKSSSLCGRK